MCIVIQNFLYLIFKLYFPIVVHNQKMKSHENPPQVKNLSDLIITTKRGIGSYHVTPTGKEVYLINIKDIKKGKIRHEGLEKIKVKDTQAIEKARVEEKDLIITTKGSIFKAAIADSSVRDYVISSNLIAFKMKEPNLGDFIAAHFNSPIGQKELNSMAVGVTHRSIDIQTLMNMQIKVPPMEKQKAIAEYLQLNDELQAITKREEEIRERIKNSIIRLHMD